MTDINDKATYDYYHPQDEANQREGEKETRLEPVFSHKSPTSSGANDDDDRLRLGVALKNAETFKPPIGGTGQYGGCYRCLGKTKCCNTICTVCPICVYNVPCCPNNSCLWTIWCWCGIPVPYSFCTMFACEMIGPSVAYRGKHGELACQAVKLDESGKDGYGVFCPIGCDGFKSGRYGLREDTPITLQAEPGCC